jgi:prepilin-type N-terminal cleavage/methylation domain-containing protein
MNANKSRFTIQNSKLKTPGSAGFTLLEISLVLLIFAVILTFAIPRLRDPSSQELNSHVRRLATTLRFLRNEAVLNGRVYMLNYDLDQQRYWITSEATPDGAEAPQGDDELGIFSRAVALPNTVAFSDIVFQEVGKLNQGQMFTRFYPDGYVDPTVVHMDNGRQAYTLTIWPLTGQVSMYDGYRDFEFTQK